MLGAPRTAVLTPNVTPAAHAARRRHISGSRPRLSCDLAVLRVHVPRATHIGSTLLEQKDGRGPHPHRYMHVPGRRRGADVPTGGVYYGGRAVPCGRRCGSLGAGG